MLKNTGSQVVGCQLVSATDGSDFTGSVTCYVTGDGGTQAAGSVGSGACTHEGNGFHSYAPATAETNYNHVAFTFKGTGALTSTVQVYTRAANLSGTDIADAVLLRNVSNTEGSAGGTTLTGAVLKLTSKVDDDGAGSLKTYKTNGSDVFKSQAITTGASLEPIDALGVMS